MSSNAFDSRGDNVKVCGGTADAHPKHRYTAVTVSTDVYDVLNTRTSEKNGATGRTTDAATGNVTVSPKRHPERRNGNAPTAMRQTPRTVDCGTTPDGLLGPSLPIRWTISRPDR